MSFGLFSSFCARKLCFHFIDIVFVLAMLVCELVLFARLRCYEKSKNS